MARKRAKQGQVFFLDALFAGALIVVVILAVYSLQYYVESSRQRSYERTDLELRLLTTAALLVETQGWPLNWSSGTLSADTVNSLGLTTGTPLDLSHAKLTEFADLLDTDASAANLLTGFQGPGYAYRVRLFSHGQFDSGSIFTAGTAPAAEAEDVIRVLRYGMYNGSTVAIEFTGWAS